MGRIFFLVIQIFFYFLLFVQTAFASSLLCQDNFSDRETCLWTKIPANSDVFTREPGLFSSHTPQVNFSGKNFLLTASNFDSDYLIEFHVQGLKGFHKQAVFRWQNFSNYYLIDLKSSLDNRDSWIYLYKIKNGQEQLLAKNEYENQVGNWYYVQIRAIAGTFEIQVFDKPLLYYRDEEPFLSGAIGFAADTDSLEQTTVWYNFIKVTDLTPSNPVIFIPGLGASWNIAAMLSCDLNPKPGWSLAPYADLYQRLINTFLQNGYTLNKDFYLYAYDWRQNMEQAGKDFKLFLDNLRENNPGEFTVIGHSLGGLVIRSYLNQNPSSHHLKKVITLGSPHLGAVGAYSVWEGGEVSLDNNLLRLAASYIINHCRTPLQLSAKEIIHKISPSLQDLLPVFNYLKPKGQMALLNYYEQKEQNAWLLNNPVPENLFLTQFITVSGNDNDTLETLEVEPVSGQEKNLGLWPDGKPTDYHYTGYGDNTVLTNSSLLPNSLQERLNHTTHGDLVVSDSAIKTIFKYLGKANITVPVYQPQNQTKTTLINIPGWGEKIWQKYTLKIRG